MPLNIEKRKEMHASRDTKRGTLSYTIEYELGNRKDIEGWACIAYKIT